MATHSRTAGVGSAAPDFELPDAAGTRYRLSDLLTQGPVVLVFLRGFSWPFCRRHLSQLRQEIEQFRARGAQVVAVAPGGPESVGKFTGQNPYPFPILADAEHSVFDAYDVISRMSSLGQRPAVFIIDRDQKVVFDSIGTQQWQIPGNTAVLDEVSRLTGGGTS